MLFGPATILPFDQQVANSALPINPPAVIRSVSDIFPNYDAASLATISISWRNASAARADWPSPKPFRAISLAIEVDTQLGNTCGPTALSMTLRALGFRQASAAALTAASDYHDWLGTSPQSLASSARSFGAKAVVLNNSSLDEICRLLDSNVYCIALAQSGDALHYVVIHGYKVEADKSLTFEIADPNGYDYCRKASDFSDDWRAPRIRDLPTGINQMIIAVAKHRDLPQERFDGWCRIGAEAHSLLNRTIKFVTQSVPQACSTFATCCALPLLSLLGSSSSSEVWNMYAATVHLAKLIGRKLAQRFGRSGKHRGLTSDQRLRQLFSTAECSANLNKREKPSRKSRSSASRYLRSYSHSFAKPAVSATQPSLMVDAGGSGAPDHRRGTNSCDDSRIAARSAA